MHSLKTSADGKNFAAAEAGPWKGLREHGFAHPKLGPVTGKLFLQQVLGLTSMEVSLGVVPAGGGLPFYHRHQEHEELYIFVGGRGQFQVDERTLDVREGSVIRVSTSLIHAVPSDFAAAHMSPDLPEGHYVVIEISDDGCGIEPALKEKIFDPFFSTKFAGRGLGLAALVGVVRAHHGAVSVDSEPGRGALFRIWLPVIKRIVEADKGELARGRADEAPAREHSGSRRALVADDEEAVRSVVARILRTMGYLVETAEDGLAAVEAFRAAKAPYDLVLLDLTMPRLDGSRACEQIRALDKNVRIVLMSGYAKDMAQLTLPGGGFDAFLAKPFTLATFRGVVER